MEKTFSHPPRLSKPVYSAEELDPKWHYFLPKEVEILNTKLERLRKEDKHLRLQLQEAAAQSTENIGHDDATQESIRLTLWTISSRIDLLREAQIHHTLLPEIKDPKRVTFGTIIELNGEKPLKVAFIGGADLALEKEHIPDGVIGVTYRSPLGKLLIGKKVGERVQLAASTYTVESIDILLKWH